MTPSGRTLHRSHPRAEEADTAGDLAPRNGNLVVPVGLSEENSSLTSGWADDDPSFRSSIAREDGESSINLNPSLSTKNAIAGSYFSTTSVISSNATLSKSPR